MRNQYEAADQETIFRWARLNQGKYPELALMFHIPNGGSRNKLEAANLKRQGVKAGVPDICLPVARSGFHGLFIELKHGNNKLTDLQKQWLHDLYEQEYMAVCLRGWEDTVTIIEQYLNSKFEKVDMYKKIPQLKEKNNDA